MLQREPHEERQHESMCPVGLRAQTVWRKRKEDTDWKGGEMDWAAYRRPGDPD